ncbi:hypothetical protein BN1723_008844 [Verticillium longisporum]|uniref:Uncharacterized protein n=1 Tax=Verticillium longisporum TaxID=100787 RepID=A0A0G4KJ93_VERLO|nr:hypothetical protein BN1723_008844 [Verticillium longisporum]
MWLVPLRVNRLLNASPWCQVRNNGGSFWGLGVPDRERSCRSMPLAVVFDLSLVFRRDRSIWVEGAE